MDNVMIEPIDQFAAVHRYSCKKYERTLHLHNNAYELMLFKSGNIDYFIDGSTYSLRPGDLTFIPPNSIHGFFTKDNSPYERLPLHIEKSYIEKLSTDQTDLLKCFYAFPKGLPHYHLNAQQMEEYETHVDTIIKSMKEKEFGYDIKVKTCITMILLLANSVTETNNGFLTDISPKVIRDTFKYINDNLSEDISVHSIAEHLNLSASRISHIFKDYTGTSLWNYIISRRIQYSKRLLCQGASVTTACFESGFKDYAHFIKTFQKNAGCSPGRYAKNCKDALISDLE